MKLSKRMQGFTKRVPFSEQESQKKGKLGSQEKRKTRKNETVKNVIFHIIDTVLCLIACLFNELKNVLFPWKWRKKEVRFPLLDLHYVAIREVLNVLDPIDYINFSKASKACRTLTAIKKPYKVTVTIRDYTVFRMGNDPVSYAFRWNKARWRNGTRMIRSFTNPVESREYHLIHSENPFDSLKEFYLYARNLMGVDIDCILIDMNKFEGPLWEIIDWLRSTSREFPTLRIYGKNQRQGDLQYILDNVKFKDNLEVDTIEKLPLRIPALFEKLEIIHAPWMTLVYVMRLKSSNLAFLDTNLTNEEINVFYKSWIEMESHLNLESFEINLWNPQSFIAICLRDIPYEMGPIRPTPFPAYTPVNGSFEVTRDDGLTASICIYGFGEQFVAVMITQLAHPEKNWL
ncbi:hypothetical protein B9Z55_003138 [Caenorhabditis nigoni]|uniref:Uncharacterized protein n=1 Tax=Caenorhabditis nigoni TaxID=1611254 RepID=A0A2G5VNU1_9PELO|nr:hypothetical protein B9Z55_003138 [Caenorhabditis nigoni]